MSSIGSMTIATVAFSIMALLVKWLDRIPTEQIVFFRALVALLLCMGTLHYRNVSFWGNNHKWLLLRGVFGTIGLVCFFYSVKHLPLATSTAIQNLSPLFTIFFAQFILKERVRKKTWFFFLLALFGALIVKGFGEHSVGTIPFTVALIGAIGAGLAYNAVSRLRTTEHPLVVILYFPMVTLPIISPITYINWVPPTMQEWFLLIGVGLVVQIAQYFMTLAYSSATTSHVSIIYYLGIVLGAINGFVFFAESLSLSAGLGIAIILLAVTANTLYSIQQKNRPA